MYKIFLKLNSFVKINLRVGSLNLNLIKFKFKLPTLLYTFSKFLSWEVLKWNLKI